MVTVQPEGSYKEVALEIILDTKHYSFGATSYINNAPPGL